MSAVHEAREIGLAAGRMSVAATERDDPLWGERCLIYLRLYARQHMDFTGESFREWAEAKGLPPPKDLRAYGPIIAKAIRDRIILKTGYKPTISSHGSARATYRRAV